jgi:uncharacterized membrane protein YphA (DoxX/SURF4 family)
MNLVQRVEHWGDAHHPQWLDIVRILLGAFLCYNRMSFGSFTTLLMSNYVAFAHLLGGFLLILGALTRFACLINIPILIGAVFFVNTALYSRPNPEVLLSIVVLLLLVCFLVVGNGPVQLLKFREGERGDTI